MSGFFYLLRSKYPVHVSRWNFDEILMKKWNFDKKFWRQAVEISITHENFSSKPIVHKIFQCLWPVWPAFLSSHGHKMVENSTSRGHFIVLVLSNLSIFRSNRNFNLSASKFSKFFSKLSLFHQIFQQISNRIFQQIFSKFSANFQQIFQQIFRIFQIFIEFFSKFSLQQIFSANFQQIFNF